MYSRCQQEKKKNQSGTGSAPLESYRRGQGLWADSHIKIFLISIKAGNTKKKRREKMFPKYNNLKMVSVSIRAPKRQSSACSLKMGKKILKQETQAQEWQLAQELLLYFSPSCNTASRESFARTEELSCNSRKMPSFLARISGPQRSYKSAGVQVLSKRSNLTEEAILVLLSPL